MEKPSPEQLAQHPKTPLDGVYTVGPGKKLYYIPNTDLARYEVAEADMPEHDTIPEPETDEVAGRHAVPLMNGTIGWHTDWLYGPYIWVSDGRAYRGMHRHPWGTILAVDPDNY